MLMTITFPSLCTACLAGYVAAAWLAYGARRAGARLWRRFRN